MCGFSKGSAIDVVKMEMAITVNSHPNFNGQQDIHMVANIHIRIRIKQRGFARIMNVVNCSVLPGRTTTSNQSFRNRHANMQMVIPLDKLYNKHFKSTPDIFE